MYKNVHCIELRKKTARLSFLITASYIKVTSLNTLMTSLLTWSSQEVCNDVFCRDLLRPNACAHCAALCAKLPVVTIRTVRIPGQTRSAIPTNPDLNSDRSWSARSLFGFKLFCRAARSSTDMKPCDIRRLWVVFQYKTRFDYTLSEHLRHFNAWDLFIFELHC